MLRRLLAPALVVLVIVLASGCASSVSPAVRVGDHSLSNDDLLDEVAEWAGNSAAVDQTQLANESPGTYPLELVRQLLQQRIDFMLHNQEFERLDLALDDELRDQALRVLFGDPSVADQAFAEFSDEFAREFTDDVARQIAVSEELGEDYNVWRNRAYEETEIELNPRYGRWDAESGQIVAPSGPVQPVDPFAIDH